MSTDRELLEAAAKAAGIVGTYVTFWDTGSDDYRGPVTGLEVWNADQTERWLWNPLDDDGQALRLAVKLGIRVEPSPCGCSVMWPSGAGGWLRVETVLNSTIGADTETSTRRAIVRAAAAMAGAA